MAEAGTSECENQKTIITNLLKTALKKDETWYLLDSKWYKQWKKYVGFDSWDAGNVGEKTANPGVIDNSSLFKEEKPGVLKDNLIEEMEYVLMPEEAWNKLVTWYGLADDQEPIARKVIEQGMFVKHCKVEVYLMELRLCLFRDLENMIHKEFSRANTIGDIDKEIRRLFNVPADKKVRLWNKYLSNTYEELNKKDCSVQDSGLYQNQTVVMEEKNEDGSWPKNRMSSWNHNSSGASGSGYGYGGYDGYGNRATQATPGVCGLSNLGNTCFMNSAIQCMSNVPELTDYFLTQDWRSELNTSNPLGMNGEIATSYAELIRNMWSGNNSYTVPRNFKVAVGRFAPQFSGYQQQDSQELMAFLLDGLHEDLNRIKKKPYVEQKEDDTRPDPIVAEEAWMNYKKRNDSVIVDTFHGQLKSTLVCPECEKVSVTFDPFCYLSLPLPDKKERFIEVFFQPFDPMKKPKHYKLTVPHRGTVLHLRRALAKLNKVNPEHMKVTDVYNRRFHKIFPPDEPLTQILDRDDIFIYEMPVDEADMNTVIMPVYMRERKMTSGYNGVQKVSQQLFGQPLLVPLPSKNCTYDTLYNCILDKMVRYVKVPDDSNEWWKKKPASKDKEPSNNRDMEFDEDDDAPANNKPQSSSSSSSTSSSTSSSVEKMENGSCVDNTAASAAGSTGGEVEDDGEEVPGRVDEAGNYCPPRFFTFMLVNSFGTSEMTRLPKDDGKAKINFPGRAYMAIDWHPRAKALFYDEKASEELEVDDTVNQKVNTTSGPGAPPRHTMQLTECLDLFTTTEKLGEQDPWLDPTDPSWISTRPVDDSWFCPKCKKHHRATKKFDLWRLPRVLVIHLKRFSYNRYWRDKLDTFIEYPTKGLDMQKWVIGEDGKPALYDLVAVCNHFGGMGGGHYTAYAKNKSDENWYYFDDSSVSQTTEMTAVNKAGYVLVYKLREAESSTASSADSDKNTAATAAADISINNQNNSSSNSNTTSAAATASGSNKSRASPPSATVSSPPTNVTSSSSSNRGSDDEEMDIN